jgi:hypothetical protein
MKKFVAVIAIMLASVVYASSCDCYYSASQSLQCGSGTSLISTYTYCGYGSNACSPATMQQVYLNAALFFMESAYICAKIK